MKMDGRKCGFALIELMIVVAMLVILAVLILSSTMLCANYWFTENGVLRELRAKHPNVTRILKVERNVFSYSRIVVEENGVRKEYLLDTNVLFNYEFREGK